MTGLAFTGLLLASVPVAAYAAYDAGRRMDQAAEAATTLGTLADRAESLSETTAEVARSLAVLADEQGPLIQDVANGVDGVVGDLDRATDVLQPVAGALGKLAPIVRGFGGSEAGDQLAQAQAALEEVDRAVEQVATTTSEVADQVEVLTSPGTIATLEEAAVRIEGVAELSRTAGHLADGYVERASTYRLGAQAVAVAAFLGTVGWLVWRVREHRRWLQLRRRGAAARVAGAVALVSP